MGRILTEAGCTISQHIARAVAMAEEELVRCSNNNCQELLATDEGHQDEEGKWWCDECAKEKGLK